MNESKIQFKRGLTSVSLFAIVLAALLFLPGSLYLTLVSGTTLSGAAVYLIALVFSEVSRLSGKHLSKQELFIIYSTVGGVAGTIPIWYHLIFKAWYVKTPFAYAYKLNGIPLPELVPEWMTPPKSSPAFLLRTFFHPDWIPVIIAWTTWSIINFIGTLSLALFFSYFFIEEEKLPFPLASIGSSIVTTLTERKEDDMKVFLMGLSSGVIVSFFVYIPYLMGSPIVPLPWLDLTSFTEKFLPGAAIGIATSPETFLTGFLLSPSVTSSMLIGSIATWIVGNFLFLKVFPDVFPQWPLRYRSGMGLASIYESSYLGLWVQIQFGFSLGLMVFLVFKVRKSLVKIFKRIVKSSVQDRKRGILPIRLALVMFLSASLGSVAIQHILIPDYPLWVSLLASLGGSFVIAFIANASIGEVGIIPPMANYWSIITYFSDYRGYPGWFYNPFFASGGSAGLVQTTKIAYLTETKPIDYYKALILGFVLNLFCSFIYLSIFWLIAPIPSANYPFTLITWPVNLMTQNLFVTRQVEMSLSKVSYSAVIYAIICFFSLLTERFHIPLSMVSLTAGVFSLPPTTIMIFLGSISGRYLISRIVGKEKWNYMNKIFVAGFIAGTSVTLGLGISSSLIARSTWILPY